jgi:chemotaxis protein MotB
MPEGPDGKTIIIIKKVSGHAGHHGGAWKVAYADFVTAMMALFMVLWLVNSASEPTRQRIASYFRKPGIFQQGSGTPLEIGGGGILPEAFAPPADANSQVIINKKMYEIEASSGKVKGYFDPAEAGKGGEGEGGQSRKREQVEFNRLKEDLEKLFRKGGEEKVGLLGEVDIKVDRRGLLVEIMDTENASMFQVGRATILPEAGDQLLKVAEVLKMLPNPIDIEGHTDARPFRGKLAESYDNWNLSSDRAHAARRALERAGLERWKIARVVGYADQRPKVPTDPFDPSNRRITIAMRFTEQAKAALAETQTAETKPRIMEIGNSRDSKPLETGSAAQSSSQLVEQAITPASVQTSAEESSQASASESQAEQQSRIEEQPITEEQEETGLRIEVGTMMPEGAIIEQTTVEHPPRPARIEKDKIFGDNNSFFVK